MEVVEGEGTAVASWRSQEHDNEGRNFEQLCDASFFSRPFGFDSFFFSSEELEGEWMEFKVFACYKR